MATNQTTSEHNDPSDDVVGQMASIIVERFGTDARTMVERQLNGAQDAGRSIWQAISARLSGQSTRPE